jgi:hypothetical protein
MNRNPRANGLSIAPDKCSAGNPSPCHVTITANNERTMTHTYRREYLSATPYFSFITSAPRPCKEIHTYTMLPNPMIPRDLGGYTSTSINRQSHY